MAANNPDGNSDAASSDICTAYELGLRRALAAMLLDCGFQSSTRKCLRLLQATLEHYLRQVGQSARAYAEASGRTQPVLGDVTMALVDYGITVSSLIEFARRPISSKSVPQRQRNIPAVFGHDWLSEAALKRPSADRKLSQQQPADRPSHIPDHLPPYPRPHTFVSTPAFRLRHCHQPRGRRSSDEPGGAVEDSANSNGYVSNSNNGVDFLADNRQQQLDGFDLDAELYRRRGAEHRRQTELSLTRFLAATGQTHSLFLGETSPNGDSFRLTANELSSRPYVAALTAAAAATTSALTTIDANPNSSIAAAGPSPPGKPRPNHPNPFLRPPKFPL